MGLLSAIFGPPDIGKLKAQADFAGLVRAARHKDAEVQRRAREALVELKETAADHLFNMLVADPPSRTLAATLIEEMSVVAKTALHRLLLLLQKEDWEGFVGLGREAVPDLLQMFRVPTAFDFPASAAALTLEVFTPAEALEPLAVLLEEDDRVREGLAALALVRYGRPGAERVCRTLGNPIVPQRKRICATHVLARMGPSAAPYLKKVLAEREDDVVAFCAIALGATGDPGALETVRERLGTIAQPELRAAVEEAFALVAAVWAKPPDSLIRAVGSDDNAMRIMAALSLGHLREPKAAQALRSALADPHPEAFSAKAVAIAKIGDREAIDALARQMAVAAAAGDSLQQVSGIRALAECADPSTAGLLAPFLKSPDFSVRIAAGLTQVALAAKR